LKLDFGTSPNISKFQRVKPSKTLIRGVAAAARRRHDLEVEDEGLLKDFVIIFIFS
jgi:hypothetical protein